MFSSEFFYGEPATLLLAILWAAILIDLVAGPNLEKFIPSPDKLFAHIAQALTRRLDRPSRSGITLLIRGGMILLFALPLLLYLGLYANQLLSTGLYGQAVIAVVLVPCIAQRQSWQLLIAAGVAVAAKNTGGSDPHQKARTAASRVILNFCTKLVPLTVWWCLGGFALLFPYLLLSNLVKKAEKRRTGSPYSPFFLLIAPVYEIATAPFSIAAALLLALAHFFLPGTNLGVFASFNPTATNGPVSRFFALNAVAHGLGLCFEADTGEKISKISAKKAICWIGPKTGRAQLEPSVIRSIWLVMLIAFSFYLVATAMTFALLLQR